MPDDWSAPLFAISVVIPMTSPRELSSGPPELPGVHRCIGLYRVFDRIVVRAANRTDRRDDAARHRTREAEWIANRVDPLTDGEVCRLGERCGLQIRRVANLQEGEIVSLVDADDSRLVPVFVRESDFDSLRIVDDVVVSQDVPLLVEDETGTLPLLRNSSVEKVECHRR